MTDINLKTLSPDTSLPTTGFLFGADSQASTNPSVYSTQTVATTLLGSTSLTGDVLTASAPVLNLSQQWNSVGTTFTGLKFNVDTTTYNQSAAASLLMDLQVGGTSKFSVRKDGSPLVNTQFSGYRLFGYTSYAIAQISAYTGISNASAGVLVYPDGTGGSGYGEVALGSYGVRIPFYSAFAFSSSSADVASSDTIITRKAAANLRFGAADAASPVAQTLSVQSVVAGTSNTAGAAFTITGSQGTGTGAGGSIVFQVAPAGGSGTAQNTLSTFLEATSARAFNIYNTYTDASNYSRAVFSFSAPSNGTSAFTVNANSAAGSGTAQELWLKAANNVYLGGAAGYAWTINNTGHFFTGADNVYDIGQSSTNRPRNVYVATSITPGAGVVVASLPTPATGMVARVTNALAPAIGTAVAGGGAAQALVWYNGANWTVIGV